MRFFTPELLDRSRSLDDAVAEQAADEWDAAGEAYRRHLKDIRSLLPAGARRFHRLFTLHDAEAISLVHEHDPARYLLDLRLMRAKEGEVLRLSYTPAPELDWAARIIKHPQGEGGRASKAYVLYHEFGYDAERGFATHNLLLTSGLEIEFRIKALTARGVTVTRPLTLSPDQGELVFA
ncbi:MAG: hypothetical protein ACRC33_23570 [Gemmataceae bacterium]